MVFAWSISEQGNECYSRRQNKTTTLFVVDENGWSCFLFTGFALISSPKLLLGDLLGALLTQQHPTP